MLRNRPILYCAYNTLCIHDLHVYQLLVLVHKFMHHNNELPKLDYFTVNSSVHVYTVLEHEKMCKPR